VLRALALVLLADVELAMGMAGCGMHAISLALPTVLAHGSVEGRGYARLVYAKCQYAAADEARQPGSSGGACPAQTADAAAAATKAAIKSMAMARGLFRSVGAKRREREALYCLAQMHHAAGDRTARNLASRDFRRLLPITVG
jgi:hypothetical protein